METHQHLGKLPSPLLQRYLRFFNISFLLYGAFTAQIEFHWSAHDLLTFQKHPLFR